MIGHYGAISAQIAADPYAIARTVYGASIVGTAAVNGASSYGSYGGGTGFGVRGSWGDVYAETYNEVFAQQIEAGASRYYANLRAKRAANKAQKEEKARIRAGVQVARAEERTERMDDRQRERTKRRKAGGGFDVAATGQGLLDVATSAFAPTPLVDAPPVVDVSETGAGETGAIPPWIFVVGGLVVVGGIAAVLFAPKKKTKKPKKTRGKR